MNKKQTGLKPTFQTIPNIQNQKVPQRASRSKSRSRSKISSINKAQLRKRPEDRSKPKLSTRFQNKEKENSFTANYDQSQSINQSTAKQSKRNNDQQQMMQIIRLKNKTMQIQKTFLQGYSYAKINADTTQCNQMGRLEEISNFLDEMQLEIKTQTKQICDSYIEKINALKDDVNADQCIPMFSPISVSPQISMQKVQEKLYRLQNQIKQS